MHFPHQHAPIRPQGYVLVLALLFFGVFFTVGSAYLNSVLSSSRSVRYDVEHAQSLAIAEAGIDEAIYRLNQDAAYTGETNTAFGVGRYTIVVSDAGTNTKRVTVTGSVPNATAPLATSVVTVLAGINTSIVSFHYGVQVGAGGVDIENNGTIDGNLYSDGSLTGNGTITGDATVAGTGSINGFTVNGTARAHSISNCTIGGDAYYQTNSGCSVAGTLHPGSADPAIQSMPITDAQIAAWEATAAAGGVLSGPYTVANSQTLGPKEINGNLTINGTLTLSGIVWVKGNIVFSEQSALAAAPTLGNAGAILIADVPGSEAMSGTITLSNNVAISGNGSPNSYPMLLSTNSGSNAISVSNNAASVILYASRGTVSLSNHAGANQITAYRLSLENNATVTYQSGLQSSSFSSGPGGSWTVIPRSYAISR